MNFDPKAALIEVCARRPDALFLISAVSGIPEKRLKQIRDGNGDPVAASETMLLEMWSKAT